MFIDSFGLIRLNRTFSKRLDTTTRSTTFHLSTNYPVNLFIILCITIQSHETEGHKKKYGNSSLPAKYYGQSAPRSHSIPQQYFPTHRSIPMLTSLLSQEEKKFNCLFPPASGHTKKLRPNKSQWKSTKQQLLLAPKHTLPQKTKILSIL